MPLSALIRPRSFAFEATTNGIPATIIQITELLQSYMIWVGTMDADLANPVDEETVERLAAAQGCLAKDWACAMPPIAVRGLLV